MILSMTEQARLFFISVVIGFMLGFGYDWLRVLRRIVKHFDVLVQAEDIFYWLISCGILFFVMLKNNYGEIRIFLIFGAFMGMVVYFNTISDFFMKASMAIIEFIKKTIKLVITLILAPFKFLWKIILIPVKFFHRLLYNSFKKIKMLLKKNRFCVTIGYKVSNLIKRISLKKTDYEDKG